MHALLQHLSTVAGRQRRRALREMRLVPLVASWGWGGVDRFHSTSKCEGIVSLGCT